MSNNEAAFSSHPDNSLFSAPNVQPLVLEPTGDQFEGVKSSSPVSGPASPAMSGTPYHMVAGPIAGVKSPHQIPQARPAPMGRRPCKSSEPMYQAPAAAPVAVSMPVYQAPAAAPVAVSMPVYQAPAAAPAPVAVSMPMYQAPAAAPAPVAVSMPVYQAPAAPAPVAVSMPVYQMQAAAPVVSAPAPMYQMPMTAAVGNMSYQMPAASPRDVPVYQVVVTVAVGNRSSEMPVAAPVYQAQAAAPVAGSMAMYQAPAAAPVAVSAPVYQMPVGNMSYQMLAASPVAVEVYQAQAAAPVAVAAPMYQAQAAAPAPVAVSMPVYQAQAAAPAPVAVSMPVYQAQAAAPVAGSMAMYQAPAAAPVAVSAPVYQMPVGNMSYQMLAASPVAVEVYQAQAAAPVAVAAPMYQAQAAAPAPVAVSMPVYQAQAAAPAPVAVSMPVYQAQAAAPAPVAVSMPVYQAQAAAPAPVAVSMPVYQAQAAAPAPVAVSMPVYQAPAGVAVGNTTIYSTVDAPLYQVPGAMPVAVDEPLYQMPPSLKWCVHPPTAASPSIAPAPSDTMATLSSPPKQSTWDPFGDDCFSKLTTEDLLNNDLVKLEDATGPADFVSTDSKCTLLSVPGTFEPLALSDTPEKLIEGLKSPETSLLLPDLLSLADPFGGAPVGPSNDTLAAVDSLLGCSLLSNPPTPAASSVSSPHSSASATTASILDEFAPALPLTDSPVLISELGQSDGTGTGAEDEFDPIPVLGSKTPAQGDHVSSNGGDSDSSLPNLARSLIMVDQLIDL